MNTSPEDYLKNIYLLQEDKGKVTTTSLAAKMGISAAAVSDMVSKLSRAGYIRNTPYKGFALTATGERTAINLIRKHRIWEVFLTEKLGYDWDKVHDEAERLEHASSDELITRIEEYLSNPKFDPHGHPIPDKSGRISRNVLIACTELSKGDNAIIMEVSDESPEVLEYLSRAGLRLKDSFSVIDKIAFDNSLHIQTGSGKIFLSEKLSQRIHVSKIS